MSSLPQIGYENLLKLPDTISSTIQYNKNPQELKTSISELLKNNHRYLNDGYKSVKITHDNLKQFIPCRRDHKINKKFLGTNIDMKLNDTTSTYINKLTVIILLEKKDKNGLIWRKAALLNNNGNINLITSVYGDNCKYRYNGGPYSNKDGRSINSLDINWKIKRTGMAAPIIFWEKLYEYIINILK